MLVSGLIGLVIGFGSAVQLHAMHPLVEGVVVVISWVVGESGHTGGASSRCGMTVLEHYCRFVF